MSGFLADHLRGQLPDIGEGLAGMMVELARDASEDRCDRALQTLRGAQATVLQLRQAIKREAGPDGQ